MLIEITQRCNLECPTCFADSSPESDEFVSVAEFISTLDGLLAAGKDDADLVQLSGVAPTIPPQLFEIIDACIERGVRQVYINTNGVRLGTDPGLARRLAEIDAGRDRLQFYLQFDGFEEETYAKIRGAKGLLSVKRKAIQNATDAGLYVHPVMTVTRRVDLHSHGAAWPPGHGCR